MKDAPVKVTLEAQGSYRAGSPVPIKARVQNVSDAPLLLNVRLLPNWENQPGELTFSVESNGNGYNPQSMVTPRQLADADFAVVAPGKSIEREIDLGDGYGVREPGSYRVSVVYRNNKDWKKGGLSAWQGQAASDVVTVQVAK